MATKRRFTVNDVRAEVRDLRPLQGLRCVNVYDLDSRTYLVKLAAPGKPKVMLLLESGARFHTTRFSREKPDAPSSFSMKLRKHLRGQRLEDIRQVSMDRVVDFKFGSGEDCHHLILELYASGNIILTDSRYEILNVLRVHSYDEETSVAVRHIYPAEHATEEVDLVAPHLLGGTLAMSASWLQTWLRESAQQIAQDARKVAVKAEATVDAAKGSLSTGDSDGPARGCGKKGASQKAKKAAKKAKNITLKQLLVRRGSGVSAMGSTLIDHCIALAGLSPGLKIPTDGSTDGLTLENLEALISAFRVAPDLVSCLDRPGEEGYIICRKDAVTVESCNERPSPGSSGNGQDKNDASCALAYEEFVPHLLAQHPSMPNSQACEGASVLRFPSFDQAVDEYFSKIEDQRIREEIMAAEKAAQRRVDNVRQKLDERRRELEDNQQRLLECAASLEDSAQAVEAALTVLRSALDNGVNWGQLQDLVDAETKAGNPIASLVKELKLDVGKAVLRLPNVMEEGTMVDVELDVMMSAHANAGDMYEQRKRAIEKAKKTLAASETAVKATQAAAAKELKNRSLKRSLNVTRRALWFEKFAWFITSENYLVISGRDSQQNELVVKRYLRTCDIYVHADLQGASSCVVRSKDPTGKTPISPLAVAEAGAVAVCRSNAWKAKMVTSAWWVYADQVSKTAPSGEYLVSGSFMIRGKKNFLPPTPLEMGFGLLFRLDEDSISRHLGERHEKLTTHEPEGSPQHLRALPSPNFLADEGVTESANSSQLTESSGNSLTGKSQDLGSHLRAISADVIQRTENGREESYNGGEVDGLGLDGGTMGAAPTKAGTKKRISAKERRLLKKEESAPDANRSPPMTSIDVHHPSLPDATSHLVSSSSTSKQPRGKKGKQKLMKKKYRDQDEEDREMALELLGVQRSNSDPAQTGMSKAAKNSRTKELDMAKHAELVRQSEEKLRNEALTAYGALLGTVQFKLEEMALDGVIPPKPSFDEHELRSLGSFEESDALAILTLFSNANTRKIGNRGGFLSGIMRRYKKEEVVGGELEASLNTEGHGEDRGESVSVLTQSEEDLAKSSRARDKKKEEEALRALLDEEGDDNVDAAQTDVIDRLTAQPLSEDTLIHAIPVCGPYSSLQTYKYRVKLVPGTLKRGKAAKQALEIFTHSKECSARERDLIQALADNDISSAMIGDVKITGPSAVASALKKSKKVQRGQKKKKK